MDVPNYSHLYAAIRYVENNPFRAGMVSAAEEYQWSSARGHIENGSDSVLSYDNPLECEIRDWGEYLSEADDKDLVRSIRKNCLTGRPCGDEGFISKIEGILGRELKANPRGRPWAKEGDV